MVLLGNYEGEQVIRLKRFFLGLGLYFVAFLLGIVAVLTDVLTLSWSEFWGVVVLGALLQFFVFITIQTGLSRRFNDPGLTLLQILLGMLLLTYVISLVQGARGGLLGFYTLIMLFGMFELKRYEYVFSAIFAIISYGVVILVDTLNPPPAFALGESLFQLAVLAIVMLFCSYVGSYLQAIRHGLKESKRALFVSHREITMQRDELEFAHRELQDALRQLGQLAVRDELTGLFNRKQFEEILKAQVAISRAGKSMMGVLIMDIDNFSALNDQYGSEAGNQILCAFSDVARSCLRRTDVISRLEGEEFAILLPSANQAALADCAKRISEFVNDLNFDSIEADLRVSVSLGAALFQEEDTAESLLRRVEQALGNAKINSAVKLHPGVSAPNTST